MINKLLAKLQMSGLQLANFKLAYTPNIYLLVTAVIILVILVALLATQMDDFQQLTAVAPHPLPILDQ